MTRTLHTRTLTIALLLCAVAAASSADASTYVVFIPQDDPVYQELDILNNLGFLDDYISGLRPISRVAAAQLAREAEQKMADTESESPAAPLARSVLKSLEAELAQEIEWLKTDTVDDLPTMLHPLQRIQAQYIYSAGERRTWHSNSGGYQIEATEATPLLPYNDSLQTSPGSNEAISMLGWAGLGGFFTLYGQGAFAGPLTRAPSGPAGSATGGRMRFVNGAAVLGLGNFALSFGREEMWWGISRFGALAQSNNAQAFTAIRFQNLKPGHLPYFLRYLGPVRFQFFFGQLDGDRVFAHPWICGQAVSFRPLPYFEFGFNRAIMFGGTGNNSYSWMGFIGRATGFNTGNPGQGDTNSRYGAYAKIYVPQLRNTQIYYEILGEDFYQPFGHGGIKTPFKAPSYTIGVYAPALTADARTDLGAEYTLLDRRYSNHQDSLYWTYHNTLMGDALGPGAWRVNAIAGRWITLQTRVSTEFFYEHRSLLPFDPPTMLTGNENGWGGAVDLFHLPFEIQRIGNSLGEFRARAAVEYVEGINYSSRNSTRAMVQLTFGFSRTGPGWEWK